MADKEEQLTKWRNMVEGDPSDEMAHFKLGQTLFDFGDFSEAEDVLRKTLKLSPQHTQAHRVLGETLFKLGKKEEAAQILQDGIQLAHDRGQFHPRNQMQEALKKAGVAPPMPQDATDGQSAEAAAGATGDFVCRRCGRANPRMEEIPFTSEIGQKIYAAICQPCWREWIAQSIKVINEYRVNLGSPQGNQVYEQNMKEFLGIE
jgi:Fe-S cluster biosynthesis and repair protein YggX/TolA-binding protein